MPNTAWSGRDKPAPLTPTVGRFLMKRKIKFVWSCSDFAHHEHKTKLGAVICGQRQRLLLVAPVAKKPIGACRKDNRMSFLDLLEKKTLTILQQEGITKEDIRASKYDSLVIKAADRVAEHTIPLGEFYAQNTWCGEIPGVTKEWQAIEKEIRDMARAMKKRMRA